MLYDIGLTVTYSYDSPAAGGRHLLRLTPADLPGVRTFVDGRNVTDADAWAGVTRRVIGLPQDAEAAR